MNKLRGWKQRCRTWLLALLASGLLVLTPFSPLLAQAQTPPSAFDFNYTDTTYQTLVDPSATLRLDFLQLGCDFINGTNQIEEPKPYDPTKVSIPDSPYCEEGSDTLPASGYWKMADGRFYLVITGEAAEVAQVRADRGVASDNPTIKVAEYYEMNPDGTIKQLVSDVSIGNITLAGQLVGSTEPSFDGICRRDAGVLSWLVCPVVNFVNDFIGKLVGYVLDLLKTEPLVLGTARGDGLYTAWSQFRTIANILLVPLFLISIYAMIFSANNRYTVTRILPRLVVATLLMQFSFHIAGIIIDIGNVLGAGIASIFNTINGPLESSQISHVPQHLIGSSLDNAVGAAVGTGLFLALGWFFIATALPPLLIIAFAFMVGIILTFVILALRQLAIVVLVVLAPLAFALGVLPSTEKWMREWFDNLIKLVLVYPIIVLFFSAASTLSLLADSTGRSSEVAGFVAALLPVIALVATPLVFRFAGNLFRNLAATLNGMSGRLRGGLIGDPRDPFSRAYQSRVGKLERRRDHSMWLAGRPGLGWTAAISRPYDIQRQMYMAGGDRVKGYISDKFPERVKRLFLGERPFKTRWNVEPWEQKDIDDTNTFRYEAAKLRRSEAEMANLAEVAAAYIGGHADRGLGFMFGVGEQYLQGTMARDVAETSYMTIRQLVKGGQRHLGMYKFEDITHPWVHQPYDGGQPNSERLFQYGFGDYNALPDPSAQERNYKIKYGFLGVASGTLVEGQGEDVWYAAEGALRDDRILREYFRLKAQSSINADEQSFVKGVDAVLVKAELVGSSLSMRGRARTGLQQQQIQQMAEEGEDVRVGGFRTPGNEITAMEAFVAAAKRARDQRSARGLGPRNGS